MANTSILGNKVTYRLREEDLAIWVFVALFATEGASRFASEHVKIYLKFCRIAKVWGFSSYLSFAFLVFF
jgi:hypothetical protein